MTDPTGPGTTDGQDPDDAPRPPLLPPPAPTSPSPGPRFVQPYPGAPPVPVDDGAPGPGPYPPPAAGADTRPKTLAIVALCLACGGALIGLVPFLGILAVPLLIAAAVIAIVALVKRSQGGTGFSIAALAISALSAFLALFLGVSVLLLALAEGWVNDDDRRWGEEQPGPDRDDDPYAGDDPYADRGYGAAYDLEIVETAFGADAGGETWWAVVLENPNDDAVFDFGELSVIALDADGETLEVAYEYLGILPGTTAVVGTFAETSADEITALGVELPGADTAWVTGDALGSLTAADVTTTTSTGATTVTGVIRSTMADAAEYPIVSLIARDPSGAVIDVAVGFADSVPGGGEASFEAVFTPSLPEGTTVEAYPAL